MTMFPNMVSLILGVLWIVVHFFHHMVTYTVEEVRWNLKHIFNRLISCIPAYSQHGQLVNIFKSARRLREEKSKFPKHLGVVVFSKEPLRPVEALRINFKLLVSRGHKNEIKSCPPLPDYIDLQTLAKVVCCAWIADIPVISLYDHSGYIKSHYKEFMHYVHEEISQNLWVVRERTELLPTIQLHNVLSNHKQNGYTNEKTNGVNNGNNYPRGEVFNICLFGNDDGKEAIVQTCKALYKELIHSNNATPPDNTFQRINKLDEKAVDRKINSLVDLQFISPDGNQKSEPDLLISLGKVVSTIGFLPWQIRLTEMHWLPSLKRFDENDFLHCLINYAHCNQRFGT